MPNGLGRHKPPRRPIDRLTDYAIENPIKVLSISALSIGGAMLLMFFGRIGFMPDIDLKSASSVLYAVALLGLFVLLLVALMLVAPGLSLYGLARALPQGEVQPRRKRIALAALIPYFMWMVMIVLVVLAPASFYFCGWKIDTKAVLSSFPTVLAMVIWFWADKEGHLKPVQGDLGSNHLRWWTAGTASALFVMLLAPASALLLVASGGDAGNRGGATVWLALIASVVVFVFTTAMIGLAKPSELRKTTFLGSTIGLFSAMYFMGNFSFAPLTAISLLRLGNLPDATLVLSSASCQKAREILQSQVCQPLPDEKAPVVWRGAFIVSRIGGQVMLSTKDDKDSPRREQLRVVLDKSEILAWGISPDASGAQASSAASSPSRVALSATPSASAVVSSAPAAPASAVSLTALSTVTLTAPSTLNVNIALPSGTPPAAPRTVRSTRPAVQHRCSPPSGCCPPEGGACFQAAPDIH